MDPQNAKTLLDDTFNNGYDEGKFLNFINELFNGFDASKKKYLVPDAYKEYIDSDNYKSLGEYKDGSGKLIDVLAIKLKKSTSRDRARTMQRNLVAKYLSENNKHAALVAFYGYDPDDWRFSFVKLDYRREKDDSGRVKTVEDLTPAKRYSFLVGVYEPNHTCRSQFLRLVEEENKNPSFEEIETAFSIEKVTKIFFEKYKGLFLELKDALDAAIEKDLYIKEDFDNKDLSTVDFAKKLLGQIVFLYFLQKKGWLGVERDKNTGKFKEWGSGPKNFLKKLFNKEIVQYDNFFNDVLEPLFYEALAREHDGDYYSRFECKIPFLNGGLFEPINDYNWQETDILLDNTIFEKIIGTFNEFNFTVKEDEPLEKEVAVDPEMLGKVFENLLDVKDRKSKGAFYTPREIVHYMCQQSLINYLETNTKDKKISREDLEMFIQFGDYSSSADQRYLIEINKLLQDIRSGISKNVVKSQAHVQDRISKLTLPISIISNKELIDRLLADIKVVDPAVGSGAFPVGMMNEIVKARSILTFFWFDDAKSSERTTYNIKRQTIQNCLYGVDLDSSAVDITKLRFWLSLIVDEDDMEHIQPLPNLDNKIMCGNSLLEEFEGIKLFDENMLGEPVIDHSFEIEQIDSKIEGLNQELNKIYTGKTTDDEDPKQVKKQIFKLENEKKKLLSSPKEKTQQLNLSDADNFRIKQSQRKLRGLRALQKQFFDAQSKKDKIKLRDDIDNLEWELIEETLKENGNEESIQKLQQYKKAKSKPFFLWKLYFAEVFQRENPGFDVVIGNPPYVKEYTNRSAFDGLRNSPYYQGKMDLWYFFGCIGIDLLCEDGIECYIAPNNWISNAGALKFRNKIVAESQMLSFIDFGNYKVFTAGIQTMVYIIKKNHQINNYSLTYSKLQSDDINSDALSTFLYRKEPLDYFLKYSSDFKREDFENRYITFYRREIGAVLSKIKMMGDTYLNKSETAQGVVAPQDSLNKKNAEKLANQYKVGDGIFILSDKEKANMDFYEKELELIKPYYTTNELHKYYGTANNQYWLIYTKSGINRNISKYPHIKDHLEKFKPIITSDNKPYGLHRARNEYFFTGESIVSLRKCSEPTFTYCDFDCYVSQTFVVIKTDRIDLKYLTGILNSQLIKFWLYYEGKLQGNNYQVDSEPLMNVPIKVGSDVENEMVVDLVDQILVITKNPDYLENSGKQAKVKNLEKQIDQFVYELYDLTPKEIEIVGKFNGGK